jgi:ParB family chromosome partitioning protein
MSFVDPEWAPLIQEGIITFASLLETFKALPQDLQSELVELARSEKRALTSGDIKKAREGAKPGNPGQGPAVAAQPPVEVRDPNTVDLVRGKTDKEQAAVSAATKVAEFIKENTPENETYRREAAADTAPAAGTNIADLGGDANIARDAQPGENARSKRELKLTMDQLMLMLSKAHPAGNTPVSILMPVEEMKALLGTLGADVPSDEDQLTLALINRLNSLASGE